MKWISPAVGFSLPVMRLKSVVLPAPFGPTRQRNSPEFNLKLRLLVAVRPPNRLVSDLVSRIGDIFRRRVLPPRPRGRKHILVLRTEPVKETRAERTDRHRPESRARVHRGAQHLAAEPAGVATDSLGSVPSSDRDRRGATCSGQTPMPTSTRRP